MRDFVLDFSTFAASQESSVVGSSRMVSQNECLMFQAQRRLDDSQHQEEFQYLIEKKSYCFNHTI